jgi:hypothetical protein
MMLVVDKELQAIADKKDANKIREAANETLILDVNDCDDDVGSRVDGIEIGLKLAAKARKLQRQTVGRKVRVFKLTFSDYDDDDGIAIFVGTKESVREQLEKL